MLSRFFLPVAALFGLWGCGAFEREEPGRAREAIIDGEPSPSGPEDAVLLLRATTPGFGERLCGASLVADNLVVTARHCVAYVTPGPFRCATSGERVEGEPGAGRMGLDLPAENLEFFTNDVPRGEPVASGREVVSTLSDSACSNDLAFVVLDRALMLPIFALRRGRPALEGERVVAVGYGAERSATQSIDFETQRRRRKADLAIAGVGPDAPDAAAKVPPRVVVVEGPSACLGDSGGPLLAAATNALVAVHSLIEGDCAAPETRGFYTHLPPLFPWAERAFEASGSTPTLEPDPSVDPCAEGACGGTGGEDGTGTGGSSAESTGGSSVRGGEGGTPAEPPDPHLVAPRRTARDSGCAIAGIHGPSPLAGAAAWFLALVARRLRRGLSAGRRGDRHRARVSAA